MVMSKPCEILALKAIIKYLQRRHFRIPRVEYELGLSRVPSKVRTQYATLHMHVRVNSGGGVVRILLKIPHSTKSYVP